MRNEKLKFEMRLMFSFEDDILVICRGGVTVKSNMVYKLCKHMVYKFKSA